MMPFVTHIVSNENESEKNLGKIFKSSCIVVNFVFAVTRF